MASKAISVTLGEMGERAQEYVRSGRYASMSEVVRAGLRALDWQEAALDEIVRAKVAEALANPRPTIPMEEAFEMLRERAEARRRG